MVETDKIRDTVRERYAEIAMQGESCCSPATSQRTSCCGQATTLSQS